MRQQKGLKIECIVADGFGIWIDESGRQPLGSSKGAKRIPEDVDHSDVCTVLDSQGLICKDRAVIIWSVGSMLPEVLN